VSAYHGFEPFPFYELGGTADDGRPLIAGRHPRFTMVGLDFETVRGDWGMRGEVAATVEDSFQSPDLATVDGSSVDAGVGIDRQAGSYRVGATVLFHREAYATPIASRSTRHQVSLIMSADRTFARERYRARAFGVANTTEGSGFARGIGTAELRENLALEGSVGWFLGRGDDLIGRFSESDFVYVRLKYSF
jgi:hypothetical protein